MSSKHKPISTDKPKSISNINVSQVSKLIETKSDHFIWHKPISNFKLSHTTDTISDKQNPYRIFKTNILRTKRKLIWYDSRFKVQP